MQSRICAYEKCKKEFIPHSGRQIYCCETCQIKRNIEKRVVKKKKQGGAKAASPAPKRKRRPMRELARLALEAKEAGMHYGDYVAKVEGVAEWKLAEMRGGTHD